MYTAVGVLAALEHRHHSGVGQYVDLALFDCVVGLNSYQALNHFLNGQVPTRMGNAHTNMVPYRAFRCRDGHVIVAVGNDTQFESLCGVIERPDLALAPRFTESAAADIVYTDAVSGIFGNYLAPSLAAAGLDPAQPPAMEGANTYKPHDHRPKAWRDIWGAGQGGGGIDEIPSVAGCIARLGEEYARAQSRLTSTHRAPLGGEMGFAPIRMARWSAVAPHLPQNQPIRDGSSSGVD